MKRIRFDVKENSFWFDEFVELFKNNTTIADMLELKIWQRYISTEHYSDCFFVFDVEGACENISRLKEIIKILFEGKILGEEE